MSIFEYSVTPSGPSWGVVNRKSRKPIMGPFKTQKDAEDAAVERAKRRAKEGHGVHVFIEDVNGAERHRDSYYPPDTDDE